MHSGKKIGITAFEAQDANSTGVVVQRQGIKAAHSGLRKIMFELGACFFAVALNFIAVLPHVHNLFGQSRPLQNAVQRRDLRRVHVYLRKASHRAQLESAALF